jgi:Protein of unknown function (DUF616)
MTKVALLQANLGGIDSCPKHTPQELPTGLAFEYSYFSEFGDLTPRPLSLTPRMQAKLPKMLSFEYVPDADFVIWLDSAHTIRHTEFVTWMLGRLGQAEICLMPHPERRTIKEEVAWTESVLTDRYFEMRYKGEPMLNQVQHYCADVNFSDDWLAAAGCFIYRVTDRMKQVMKDWLIECYRWSCQDQLSLPYVLQKHHVKPAWLNYSVYNCPYLLYTPHK